MPFNPQDAARKANFVQSAYRMFSPGVLQPAPDPALTAAGYELIYYLNADDFKSRQFYGYLARAVDNSGSIVLAIRGTETPAEWLLDFAAIPVPFTPKPDVGFVALGFQSIFDTFEFVNGSGASLSLMEAVQALAEGPGGISNLLITGHSLGAALATLASATVAATAPPNIASALSSYTYASPRVGLPDFASWFNNAVAESYRIWNVLDIVPEVPTFPFLHVAGLGDPIVQDASQLETLVFTPQCEHDLTSYQWLLDPSAFALRTACSDVEAVVQLFSSKRLQQHRSPSLVRSTGARAIARSLRGH